MFSRKQRQAWGSSRLGMGAAFVALVLVAGAVLLSRPAVAVTDTVTGRSIICRTVSSGEPVRLSYTHSMYGGRVTEEYAPGIVSGMRRTSMYTSNEAAAEYYAYLGGVRREGSRYYVPGSGVDLGEVVVRVDNVGGQRLRIGSGSYDMVLLAGAGRSVTIRYTRLFAAVTSGCWR